MVSAVERPHSSLCKPPEHYTGLETIGDILFGRISRDLFASFRLVDEIDLIEDKERDACERSQSCLGQPTFFDKLFPSLLEESRYVSLEKSGRFRDDYRRLFQVFVSNFDVPRVSTR